MSPVLQYAILLLLCRVSDSNNGFSFIEEFEKLGLYTGPLDPDYSKTEVKDKYDFVIIGAGSAGAVLANRLSEIPEWTVLLLEAGGSETVLTEIPLLISMNINNNTDWGYTSEPQTNSCLAYVGNKCRLFAGKSLGGSSAINGMIYSRGNRADFDNWAALGNDGWGYKDVLPYFLKSEDNRDPILAKTPFHSTGGYLTVEYTPWRTPVPAIFVQAAEMFGYKNKENNGRRHTGASIYQTTTRAGRRCSTNKAFLRPISERPNLHISTYTHVTKILINTTNNLAYGVHYVRNGKHKTVLAKKEVIVSAGAFNSPRLLMLSGVGPQEHLQSLSIPVIVNSRNVGQNLMNHIGHPVIFTSRDPISFNASKLANAKTVLEYVFLNSGPLTSPGTCQAYGFFPSSFVNRILDLPDTEIQVCGSVLGPEFLDSRINSRGYMFEENFYDAIIKPLFGKNAFAFYPLIVTPKSRGSLLLRSSNPFDAPLIDTNFFTIKEDIYILIEAIRLAIRIGLSEPFKAYGTQLYSEPIPGCGKFNFNSDTYWECAVRHYTYTTSHYCGTCKMGPPTDSGAAVDPQLRVYGVKHLRVVDASIMPVIPRSHTNAVTIMIGEKAADMIKLTWMN